MTPPRSTVRSAIRRGLACSAALIALVLAASAGQAQERNPIDPDPADRAPASPAPVPAPELEPAAGPRAGSDTIGFAADRVDYDSNADVVTASGHVELQREAYRLRSDSVSWNRKTGQVVAEGNVALTSPQGDTAYGDQVTLTDTLRDGMVENLLIVLDSGGRLAARSGTRFENGDFELDHASYSPCAVEDADGCPKDPSWQIRAARVHYDKTRDRVRYYGARGRIVRAPARATARPVAPAQPVDWNRVSRADAQDRPG